jgi:predicted dehydrogenase
VLDRLLIVGFGSIGARHARIVRQLNPDARIAVLRHRGCEGMEGRGVDHCVTNLEDALMFRPQAAVIANAASHHIDVALPLARAGVPLLVEKPLAMASRPARELIDTCQTHGVTLMTGYNLRFVPSLQYFAQCIRERQIGRVLSVRAEVGQFLPTWRPESDYRRTVSANAALGGGVLLELSHEFHYLRWVFGEVEWVSAVQRRQSSLDIDVDDTAHVILGFLHGPHRVPLMTSLNMDFIRHDVTRCCTAIGESGSLRWDGVRGSVEKFSEGGEGWECLFEHRGGRDESYVAEWRHFFQCMREGRTPDVSGIDGMEVLRVVEAARESSLTGRVIRVDPL